MNFRDVAARELHDRRLRAIRRERLDENLRPGSSRLRQGIFQIGHLIAGEFAPVRVWQVTVRGEHRHLSEHGFNADAAGGVFWSGQLYPGGARRVGKQTALRKTVETGWYGGGALRRDGLPVF